MWKYVFKAMIFPAIFYIVWDMIFTKAGVWSFNPDYITGIKLYNLPMEEVMFFFVVPYCCVFIYVCIKTYFPKIKNNRWSENIFLLIAISLLLISLTQYGKDYTFYTFLFCGTGMLVVHYFKRYFSAFNTPVFLIAYLIILIPFLIVNGLLTAIPVVIYNDHENLMLRLYTIPVEDIFYGMLLILWNVAGYERLKV